MTGLFTPGAPRLRRRPCARAAGGMALIAVLWIVAALAILVTGMTQSVRQQVRVTATTLDVMESDVESTVDDQGSAYVRSASKEQV